MEEKEKEWEPARVLPSPPMTLASHGTEPELAQMQSRRRAQMWGGGRLGVLPHGVRCSGLGPRPLCGVSREAEALSAVLKTCSAGGEGRGARGSARCLDFRAGRGADDPLPRDPALAHLARRRTEAPEQRRSAWRTRGADPLAAVWGRELQAPWRGLGGRATWERVVAALARTVGGGLSFPVCVRLSVHPPASLHWALVLQEFIYPRPRK